MTQRRTGKVGGNEPKTGGQQAAEQGTQNIQSQLQQSAINNGIILADNYQAQTLVTALTFIQSGQTGPKTAAILEAFQTGSMNPLEDWGENILTWHQPIALLSSSSEL